MVVGEGGRGGEGGSQDVGRGLFLCVFGVFSFICERKLPEKKLEGAR